MPKIDGELLDEKITKCLQEGYIEGLKDLIELPDDIIKRLFIYEMEREDSSKRQIPTDILQEILMARDKKVLGLKKCDVSKVKSGELVLDEELRQYNAELEDEEEITVVRGKSQDGKDNVLYYYSSFGVTRQQRVFNTHGDIESMYRHSMFDDGRLAYIDNAVVSYQYDNQGRKKAALSQEDISGVAYYEYDKDGDISLCVQAEAISQKVKEGEYTYTIHDGYFIPRNNGYTYIGMPATETLTAEDMKRTVWGNIPQDKKQDILDGMDKKRKEEVLGVLTAVEPIFQSLFTDVQRNEQEARKRMDKVVTWFTGFAKRLKIDPKLATQDSSVMSAMKNAVHKTIGKTADAQRDLNTPTKDEKVYEGEDYGDN